MLPSAATVAGPEPEIAAKNMLATTPTVAKPPVDEPQTLLAILINRPDIPLFSINIPARIKNGIASRVNESLAANIICGMFSIGTRVPNHMATKEATPSEKEIGTPSSSSIVNVAKIIVPTSTRPSSLVFYSGFFPIFVAHRQRGKM